MRLRRFWENRSPGTGWRRHFRKKVLPSVGMGREGTLFPSISRPRGRVFAKSYSFSDHPPLREDTAPEVSGLEKIGPAARNIGRFSRGIRDRGDPANHFGPVTQESSTVSQAGPKANVRNGTRKYYVGELTPHLMQRLKRRQQIICKSLPPISRSFKRRLSIALVAVFGTASLLVGSWFFCDQPRKGTPLRGQTSGIARVLRLRRRLRADYLDSVSPLRRPLEDKNGKKQAAVAAGDDEPFPRARAKDSLCLGVHEGSVFRENADILYFADFSPRAVREARSRGLRFAARGRFLWRTRVASFGHFHALRLQQQNYDYVGPRCGHDHGQRIDGRLHRGVGPRHGRLCGPQNLPRRIREVSIDGKRWKRCQEKVSGPFNIGYLSYVKGS